MKITATCGKCSSESPVEVADEFNDDNFYELTCSAGHVTLFHIQAPKFELIFQLGVLALSDGYSREAVASFATASDVFVEFCLRVLLRRCGFNNDQLEIARKLWAKQSERQLGALACLFLNETKRPLEYLSNSVVTFRNDVVHKGRIPNRDETIEYGQAIMEFVYRTLLLIFPGARRGEYTQDIVLDFYTRRDQVRGKRRYDSQGGCTFKTAMKLYVGPWEKAPDLASYLAGLENGTESRLVFRK
jgi:hypothetical protein